MKKVLKVVAAIIENDQSEILCALRSPDMTNPNKWEFPGGKVEENEDFFSALEREIEEELACRVSTSNEIYYENFHEYDTFTIQLISIKCKIIKGVPSAREHSELIWLQRKDLETLKWAPADIPIVNMLSRET